MNNQQLSRHASFVLADDGANERTTQFLINETVTSILEFSYHVQN